MGLASYRWGLYKVPNSEFVSRPGDSSTGANTAHSAPIDFWQKIAALLGDFIQRLWTLRRGVG